MLRRLQRMLGRRGAILLCYGTVWSLYGYSLMVSPQADPRGLGPLLELAGFTVWGWCWVAAGLVAIVSAWLPEGVDWPGFLSLPAMVLPWCVSYLTAWLLGMFDRGWIGALVWGAIAVPVLVVAGWREAPRPKRVGKLR